MLTMTTTAHLAQLNHWPPALSSNCWQLQKTPCHHFARGDVEEMSNCILELCLACRASFICYIVHGVALRELTAHLVYVIVYSDRYVQD